MMKYNLTKENLEYELKWLGEPNNTLHDYGNLVRHLLNEVEELKLKNKIILEKLTRFNKDGLHGLLDEMEEQWEDVLGYEGLYQVSSFGRVKSLPKEWVSGNGTRRKHNGKFLKLSVDTSGYYQVSLYKEDKRKVMRIHQLVAMAFLDHKPDGHNKVVDHKNNDKLNNRVSNLQLITHRENSSKDKVGSSKYSGVYWDKQNSKWRSKIQINGQLIHLGLFDEEIEASQMYELALSNIDKFDGNPKEFREKLKIIKKLIW